MVSQILGNIIFILLVIFTNGFFVAAEFAIVKVRSSQIELKIRKGHRRAALAKHIVGHLDAYLSATQLGITLTSIGLGWIGEPLLADMIAAPLSAIGVIGPDLVHAIAFIISFAALTFLLITLGDSDRAIWLCSSRKGPHSPSPFRSTFFIKSSNRSSFS